MNYAFVAIARPRTLNRNESYLRDKSCLRGMGLHGPSLAGLPVRIYNCGTASDLWANATNRARLKNDSATNVAVRSKDA